MKTLRELMVIAIAAPFILAAAQEPRSFFDNIQESEAIGVSADGRVIVGQAEDEDGVTHGFVYSNGQVQDLGTLPGWTNTYVTGVSADGSVIVGYVSKDEDERGFPGDCRAFKYSNGQMHDLGGILGSNYCVAHAVDTHGRVIVGIYEPEANKPSRAFVDYGKGRMIHDLGDWRPLAVSNNGRIIVGEAWLLDSGNRGSLCAIRCSKEAIQNLGTYLGTLGGVQSGATGVSADGRVIVGWYQTTGYTGYKVRAFKYNNEQMQDLGTLPGGGLDTYATAVSADGNVIVGWADIEDDIRHAFKYSNGQMQDLGTLPGGLESFANAVSADGSVIVGEAETEDGTRHAFIYSNGQMQDLRTLVGTQSIASRTKIGPLNKPMCLNRIMEKRNHPALTKL